jgi:hypothetical protein
MAAEIAVDAREPPLVDELSARLREPGFSVEGLTMRVWSVRKIRQGKLAFIDAQECSGGEALSLFCRAPAVDLREELAREPPELAPGAFIRVSGITELPRVLARSAPPIEPGDERGEADESDHAHESNGAPVPPPPPATGGEGEAAQGADALGVSSAREAAGSALSAAGSPLAAGATEPRLSPELTAVSAAATHSDGDAGARLTQARAVARWRHDALSATDADAWQAPVIRCDSLEILLPAGSRDFERALSLAPPQLPWLAFDLRYFGAMNARETQALGRQLLFCYSSARHQRRPLNLLLSGLLAGGAPDEQTHGSGGRELASMLDAYGRQRWAMASTERTPWDVFGAERCVYLAAESDEDLDELRADRVYIIGGLVDHTDKPRTAYERARALGLATARLPVARYAKLQKPTLTTTAVVQMLMLYHELGDWSKAVRLCPAMHIAPMRKYVHWLKDEEPRC